MEYSSPDSNSQHSREIKYRFKLITNKRSTVEDHGEANHHHVINITEGNEEYRFASMHKKISEPPHLLSMDAGRPSCCIFRVPESMVDINGKAYQPSIVSIGPYHHGKPQLKMIEEHKWRYLGLLLKRMEDHKVLGIQDFFRAVQPLEQKARECYSEIIQFSSDEFLEMMVVDGCFVIELFRKVGNLVPFEPEDPIVSMLWILPFIYRDFLRLENQIPFHILQCLFDLTKIPGEKRKPLPMLALEFFNNAYLDLMKLLPNTATWRDNICSIWSVLASSHPTKISNRARSANQLEWSIRFPSFAEQESILTRGNRRASWS